MKITITIDTNQIDSLTLEQREIIATELTAIADRFWRPEFYADRIRQLGQEYGSPLKGEVEFPQHDLLIRHTVETGNTYDASFIVI